MTPRTRAGLARCRPLRLGGRIELVAPASPFDRAELEAGMAELRRLGFDPFYDGQIFDRQGFRAGSGVQRARALNEAWGRSDVDAIVAVRGGYGSVETLEALDASSIRRRRTAFVGYSDLTTLHSYLGCQVGLVSIHGPMIEGRLAKGPSAYDEASFRRSLSVEPAGELTAAGLETIRPGTASGPLFGGTLTQLLASFGTPWEFAPPAGHVLFIDEVGERPYRLHRMLTQWRLADRFRQAAAVVFGQLPRCDEPAGGPTAASVIADVLAGFTGPVLFGFPSGHTTTPLITLPFGVETRVVAGASPALVVEEAAAG